MTGPDQHLYVMVNPGGGTGYTLQENYPTLYADGTYSAVVEFYFTGPTHVYAIITTENIAGDRGGTFVSSYYMPKALAEGHAYTTVIGGSPIPTPTPTPTPTFFPTAAPTSSIRTSTTLMR